MNATAAPYTACDHLTYRMNFLDESYVAFEGAMGSIAITYFMRLSAAVDEQHLKQVARELVSANPRLRSVVEPGLQRFNLRVLPDGAVVDALFEQAWQTVDAVNAQDMQAVETVHTRLHNTSVSLGRGLLCRFVFIPDEQAPVLLLYTHHIVGDGRTGRHLVFEIVKRLNGGPPMAFQPIEAPPLWQVFGPEKLRNWPLAIWRSLRHEQQIKAHIQSANVSRLEVGRSAYMSTHVLRYFEVPVPATQLRAVARQWGVSLNALVVLAVAETFLSMAKDDPTAAAVIRQAMDVRKFYPTSRGYGPLWGNHVGVFLIVEQHGKTLQQRAQSIKHQIDECANRYAEKESFGRYAFTELLPWLGRTLLDHVMTKMIRQKKIQELSCYISNVGNANEASLPGASIALTQYMVTVPSPSLIQVVTELNDVLCMPASWQLSEVAPSEMDDYLKRLGSTFRQIADQQAAV